MNAEKASTLRLLKEGIGRKVNILDSRGGDIFHEIKAHLPECSDRSRIPILFLLSSLAFLEATPVGSVASDLEIDENQEDAFREVDGWTPADFLSHLRFEEDGLRVSLECIRGRSVFTELYLSSAGMLVIKTWGRGRSVHRWLGFVSGQSHIRDVSIS
jgi:hypothetical protein